MPLGSGGFVDRNFVAFVRHRESHKRESGVDRQYRQHDGRFKSFPTDGEFDDEFVDGTVDSGHVVYEFGRLFRTVRRHGIFESVGTFADDDIQC